MKDHLQNMLNKSTIGVQKNVNKKNLQLHEEKVVVRNKLPWCNFLQWCFILFLYDGGGYYL